MASTAAVAASAAARNALSPGGGARERALGLGDAPRIGLGAADRNARLDHFAVCDAIDAERRGHGEIAGAAAEFIEAAARVRGQHRQARLDEQARRRAAPWS